MLTALTILLASTPAIAAEKDAQSFRLSTEVEAWPVTDIDSGWWPEEGAIRVRTTLFAEGIAGIDIEGDSVVESGSNGTTHRLDHNAAEGEASIDLHVEASLYLSIDVAGYTWEDMLHEQTVDFDVSRIFESFAFSEDGGADLTMPMDAVEVFEIDQGIIPMVNVVVSGTLIPDAELTISTDAIETDDGEFTAEGQRIKTSGGSMELEALGTLTSHLEMAVQGHAEVCITWVDCYGDFDFDFEIDPIQHSQALEYDAVTVEHKPTSGGSPLGMLDDSNSADDDVSADVAGGCSTVPVTEPSAMWMIMALAALAIRRKSRLSASETR